MVQDAEIVARNVLPNLSELVICHKVVKSLEIYKEQMKTRERGKFITIYTNGANEGQRVLDKIALSSPSFGFSVRASRASSHYPREQSSGIGIRGLR
jgi:hypothetical protein